MDPAGALKMVLGVNLGKECKKEMESNSLDRNAPVVYTAEEHKRRRYFEEINKDEQISPPHIHSSTRLLARTRAF